mgnify:CR=1 FL=1
MRRLMVSITAVGAFCLVMATGASAFSVQSNGSFRIQFDTDVVTGNVKQRVTCRDGEVVLRSRIRFDEPELLPTATLELQRRKGRVWVAEAILPSPIVSAHPRKLYK